jgi:dCTP deaminase
MILSDHDLREMLASNQLVVEPLTEKAIQQNGIDLSLYTEIGEQTGTNNLDAIDSTSNESVSDHFRATQSSDGVFVFSPLHHYLLATQEFIKMPSNIMAFCGLRSTFARLGFSSPLTVIDAGFEGSLTIGVFYGGSLPIKVPVGCRFLHVIFSKLLSNSDKPYEGQYKRQRGVSFPKSLV